jgi:hypothetical protein
MDVPDLQRVLDEMFDHALIYHGYADYMRDYELIVYMAADPRTGIPPAHYRYVFRHCVEADAVPRWRPQRGRPRWMTGSQRTRPARISMASSGASSGSPSIPARPSFPGRRPLPGGRRPSASTSTRCVHEDWGDGPPRYLRPERVRLAAEALRATAYAQLISGVDPAELISAEVYPFVGDETGSLEWGRTWYDDLTQFFEAAARTDDAILVWLD